MRSPATDVQTPRTLWETESVSSSFPSRRHRSGKSHTQVHRFIWKSDSQMGETGSADQSFDATPTKSAICLAWNGNRVP